MHSPYALDKGNAALFGVCAGLSRSTGWDLTLVRVGTVLATLCLFGPVAILAYAATAMVANKA